MGKDFTRRNHHIPQKYQLGFADEKGRVRYFDRIRKLYLYGAPKKIAFENNFYTTLLESGERSDKVEKLLSYVEGKTWPLFDKLREHAPLIEAERSTVAFFAALMKTRTTAFETSSSKTADALAKGMLHILLPDAEALKVKHFEMTGQHIDQEKAEEMFAVLERDGFELVTPRQNNIKSMLEIATALERALVHMEWEIYEAPVDCKFVTSDNPFVTSPPKHLDTAIMGFGPLTPGAINILPLSSRQALFMRSGPRGEVIYKKATRDLIRAVNVLVASMSDRLIIAQDESQLRKLVVRCKADQSVNSFRPVIISPPELAQRRAQSWVPRS